MIFLYNKSGTIKSIDYLDFSYNEQQTLLSNYGNTPQWFCITQPNLWVISPNLSKLKKKASMESYDVTIDYEYGNNNLPKSAIEKYFYDSKTIVTEVKYILRYIKSN